MSTLSPLVPAELASLVEPYLGDTADPAPAPDDRSVADVLRLAARRVEMIGWYVGEGWVQMDDDLLYVPFGLRPAWAQAHIHFASRCEVGVSGCASEDCTAHDAEQALAEHLISRGLPPVFDVDRFVDFGAQIEAWESTDGMDAAEVAEVLRDCAAWTEGSR
jgi:hypothetical protein